jgi:hypothetical protein
METLASALEKYFKQIKRPSTGALFIGDYGRLNDRTPSLLASAYHERVTAQAVFNLFGRLPSGRVISPAEVGLPVAGALVNRPVLTDNAVGWIVSHGFDTSRLVAALLTRTVLTDVLGTEVNEAQQRIIDQLERAHHVWSFDYAGIARVAVLLAAEAGYQIATATHFAEATLLVLDKDAWSLIRHALKSEPHAWIYLEETYRGLRDALIAQNSLALDQLLSVALFPKDELVR